MTAKREYLVGWIRPTNRPGPPPSQELDEKMPATIKLRGVNLNFTRGTEDEFRASMPAHEAKVAELAVMKVDLIHASGAPPFMLRGREEEQRMTDAWEKKYDVPIFTAGQNHARALRALGVGKFVGASYFPEKLNDVFTKYFTEAGFKVLAMEGIQVSFLEVPKLSAEDVCGHIKRMFERHSDADGIYMLGSAWRNALSIIEPLEQTLGVPVIYPAPARWWEIQLRLGVRHPIRGYGRLLAELPEAQKPA